MAAALNAAGTRARYVDAVDVVITDGPFGGASPNLMLTDLTARKILRPLLTAGIVPVVPGFLGATPAADSDERGKARADRDARPRRIRPDGDAARPRAGRHRDRLWKDVPGLLTSDPRVVPDARVIPQLHLREASELAYFGAKVLHPRALIPIAGARRSRSTCARSPIRRRRAPRSRRGARSIAIRSRRCRPPAARR